MSSATASGANTGDGTARNRDHKQGNQGRTYTPEQKAAVMRIRKCSPTAFYDILGIEEVRATVTDNEIKKAYRKLSLLTHPDKNGHEFADEAFKMVSRAFGILSDKEKRARYDQFGTDPDSRFGQAQAQNPFGGFARRGGGAPPGAGMWGAEEMTPEEMFQRFFGGGFGGPFGGFDAGGPQFVFNFNGGQGFRVHQFGGGRPRGRPRQPDQNQQASTMSTLIGLLPLLLFFLFPLLSGLFTGESRPSTPRMFFDQPSPPYTMERHTARLKVPYYVNPNDVKSYSEQKLKQLDGTADSSLIRNLRFECDTEMAMKRRLYDSANGWFYQDPEKLHKANEYQMPSCRRLDQLGVRR
ncbi:hypothetical protein ACRALDRAFT_1077008 [Sodiomyces alcalophilus JCM 7366]|uniref:uncharacterized protein n=1 Tax=Sodiomyces alcalophilus JCM 7366 TaxID=591952 RepID=UPI0039B3B1BF